MVFKSILGLLLRILWYWLLNQRKVDTKPSQECKTKETNNKNSKNYKLILCAMFIVKP
jgi:hypothetical protein